MQTKRPWMPLELIRFRESLTPRMQETKSIIVTLVSYTCWLQGRAFEEKLSPWCCYTIFLVCMFPFALVHRA